MHVTSSVFEYVSPCECMCVHATAYAGLHCIEGHVCATSNLPPTQLFPSLMSIATAHVYTCCALSIGQMHVGSPQLPAIQSMTERISTHPISTAPTPHRPPKSPCPQTKHSFTHSQVCVPSPQALLAIPAARRAPPGRLAARRDHAAGATRAHNAPCSIHPGRWLMGACGRIFLGMHSSRRCSPVCLRMCRGLPPSLHSHVHHSVGQSACRAPTGLIHTSSDGCQTCFISVKPLSVFYRAHTTPTPHKQHPCNHLTDRCRL